MKTSELIIELAKTIERAGDLEAIYFDGASGHRPAVILAEHRTGNTVWIWEDIPELTAGEVERIMETASPEDIDGALKACNNGDRRMIAAYLAVTLAPASPKLLRRTLRAIVRELEGGSQYKIGRALEMALSVLTRGPASPPEPDRVCRVCESVKKALEDFKPKTEGGQL